MSAETLFLTISLSWTAITEFTHSLKQRVTIKQFIFVLWKNPMLFPPEQPHFIIAFCVSIRSIFSIYSLYICPRRAVCVRLFSVGLTLSRIHTATHWGPCLHPPSKAVKVHLLVSAPISVWSFQPNLFPTPNLRVSGAACECCSVLRVCSCGFVLRLNYFFFFFFALTPQSRSQQQSGALK